MSWIPGRNGWSFLLGAALLTWSPALPAQAPGASPTRLTLDEAVTLALRQSPTLARVTGEFDQARAARLGARGALLPNVNLGYGFAESSTGRLDPTGQAITNTSWWSQASASFDILGIPRRTADARSAGSGAAAAEARYEEERYRTILETKRAYFETVAARERVRVEEGRVRRQEAQLDSVLVRLEIGEAARTDRLRSEVALNEARLALIQAGNTARSASLFLGSVVGFGHSVEPALARVPDPEPLPLELDEMVRIALDQAPGMESARAETTAASRAQTSTRLSLLPSLNVIGGWAWTAAEFPPENRSWQVILQGSIPLFNGFQRESALMTAGARVSTARAVERSTELRIRAGVSDAHAEVEAASLSIRLAESNVALARKEMEANQERFRFGRGSLLEVQTAQIALQEAELAMIRARLDYQVGVATLEYLLGTELERP
ncbi:MAG: TolC family protein [Gemmatimonadales bacterium]|nr:MAG: TolC family protein [Gemmatimonadales bacterium]